MMPREHICWNPLPCTCEDPEDDATAMTPGVPREARSLSGHDIGREVLHLDTWKTIVDIHHTKDFVFVEMWVGKNGCAKRYRPHDVVQVRGWDA